MACLLQQLPAVDAKHLGGPSLRGVAQGRGTWAPVTTSWVLGKQQCWAAPGWSALWSSGPRAVSPVVVGALGGQPCGSLGGQPCGRQAPGRSALQTSGPGAISPVDWAPGWSALRTSPAAAEGGGSPCGSGGGDVTPSLPPPWEFCPESLLAEDLEKDWAPLWAITELASEGGRE